MASDFSKMKSVGARIVVTFDPCEDGSEATYDSMLKFSLIVNIY